MIDIDKVREGIDEAMKKDAPDEEWFKKHYPKTHKRSLLEAERERLKRLKEAQNG